MTIPRMSEIATLTIVLLYLVVLGGFGFEASWAEAGPRSDSTVPKVIVFDGCEYLHWGQYAIIVHKGNCKNNAYHGRI